MTPDVLLPRGVPTRTFSVRPGLVDSDQVRCRAALKISAVVPKARCDPTRADRPLWQTPRDKLMKIKFLIRRALFLGLLICASAKSSSIPPTPGLPSGAAAVGVPATKLPAIIVSDLTASRFLDQAAFGPTPADLAKVKQLGVASWLDEQLRAPQTAIPMEADQGRMRSAYLNRLSVANDQLRQRVAYALTQFIVIASDKNYTPDQIIPYLQIISRNAFGNYRNLLGEITVSAQMGRYLDMVNSNKPWPGSGANENYARELLQLFSIGTTLLKVDGTNQLGPGGATMPSYDQASVQNLALAFTGWTYAGSGNNNIENFTAPMISHEWNHDVRAKAFLGCNVPANQSAQMDLSVALDCVFKHPNVGPFVATRLIRCMVTSNPSPAYVGRVASVFNDNGSGTRGDMAAVVRAILLDSEARNDTVGSNAGRLKDPIFQTVSLTRSLGGAINPGGDITWSIGMTGQTPLNPPSVFGFYSPLNLLPRSSSFAPEFQIYTPAESVRRGNLVWRLLNSPGGDFTIDLSKFINVASNPKALVDSVDATLLYGRMPTAMKDIIIAAVSAQPDNRSRALTALYLTALSGNYVVQY